MKEALYYKKLKDKIVQCSLCPWNCVIKENNVGSCKARKNIDGKLYSLVYSNPCSIAIDPIEKKPLYHFLPNSVSLSVGTLGCNLHCLHCQNYDISQKKADNFQGREITPEELIKIALKKKCSSISYTYNEPTIFYEYVLETAKLAKKKGIKNVMVTNGYINKEPLKELYPLIDAANIDLKSMDEDFYKKVCSVKLKPILESIREIKKIGTSIEITNLIIPGYNDKKEQIEKLVKWIKENLGIKTSLHFSAFYPTYKLLDAPNTPEETLLMAKKIALKHGLKHIYLGNTNIPDSGNTYCPRCSKLLIERSGFGVQQNNIKKNLCPSCDERIEGVF
ncbi:MAG: AmmeMemoRadiSam system radical SAM enzyme [Nanoarchaeota archaeon]|nr:AmmeMemoRadiSam system radical SAM enzyme [Nanoarchaeota archaeon]